MYLILILGVIVLTVLLLSKNKPTTNSNDSKILGNQIKNTQEIDEKTVEQKLEPPEINIDQGKSYQAKIVTTEGEILVDLDVQETPVTANNFIYLSKKGFYNNTIFHRVIKDFMIQGGDPQGTGMGGPGYTFADEPITKDYIRGTVAMANSGPNTNGSQFFIMHQDSDLPKNYVIFGQVISGIDVVDKIAESEVTGNAGGEVSSPVNPVSIKTIAITEE